MRFKTIEDLSIFNHGRNSVQKVFTADEIYVNNNNVFPCDSDSISVLYYLHTAVYAPFYLRDKKLMIHYIKLN